MKTIQRVYETKYDRQREEELGNYFSIATFCMYGKSYEVIQQPFLSTYDFKVYENGRQVAWLEVKDKTGEFRSNEIIPTMKWDFAEKSNLPCLFLVARPAEIRIWNITKIIKENRWFSKREIKRREDQPEGSRKVVLISLDDSKTL